jgi:hypothetical protein
MFTPLEIVVVPVLETLKSVVVAVPEDEAMLKREVVVSPTPAKIESLAFGVVVPIPTFAAYTPVPPSTSEFDAPTIAFAPIAVAFVSPSIATSEPKPRKVLSPPDMLLIPAKNPIAVDDAPVTDEASAL